MERKLSSSLLGCFEYDMLEVVVEGVVVLTKVKKFFIYLLVLQQATVEVTSNFLPFFLY